jgi:hypothetical protein
MGSANTTMFDKVLGGMFDESVSLEGSGPPTVPIGGVDAIIEPADTRARLIMGLRRLETKVETSPPKKHGNIPL